MNFSKEFWQSRIMVLQAVYNSFFKFIQCLCLFVLIFIVPGPSFLGITVNAVVQDSSGV